MPHIWHVRAEFQQAQRFVKMRSQPFHAEHRQPCRRHFKRQRNAFQPPANLYHTGCIGVIQLETPHRRTATRDEQFYRAKRVSLPRPS